MQRFARTILEKTRLRGDRPLIGLDIGSSRLKAVQFTPAGPPHRVAAFATEPMPPGAVVDGVAVDRLAVSSAIRRLFERAAFRSAGIAAALPASAAVIKRITLPSMTSAELDAAIPWEAEQHIPYAPADVHLHYERLGPAFLPATTMDVLLVAAPRDRVAQLAGIIRDAGQVPQVIDVEALALRNAYVANHAPDRDAAVALLDIGASATTVTVLLRGEPAVVRHIPGGGRAHTEALHAALGSSLEEAEQVKTSLSPECHDAQMLGAALRSATDALVSEVRKTLDFYRVTMRADRIDRVVVSGGGSMLDGVAAALRDALHVPVDPFDPFARVSPAPGCPATFDPADARAAAIALGLAMRRESVA